MTTSFDLAQLSTTKSLNLQQEYQDTQIQRVIDILEEELIGALVIIEAINPTPTSFW